MNEKDIFNDLTEKCRTYHSNDIILMRSISESKTIQNDSFLFSLVVTELFLDRNGLLNWLLKCPKRLKFIFLLWLFKNILVHSNDMGMYLYLKLIDVVQQSAKRNPDG